MDIRRWAVSIGFPMLLVVSIGAEESLDVPPQLARITDASPDFSGTPDFILIQDVHRHAEAQRQIADIIEYAYDHWGAHRVYMEGAFSQVDLTVFHRLPEDTQKTLLANLVAEGRLSGAEWAAVRLMEREWRNPPVSPFQLEGLENPRLYAQNLKVFKQIAARRAGALMELGSLERLQNRMGLPEPNILRTQLDRARALIELRLTPEDYALYMSANDVIPKSPILTPTLRLAERFYELVNERSAIFLQEANHKLPAGQGPRILVIGGFHTHFIAKELLRQNASFVVLAPKVTAMGNRDAYEKQLLDSVDTLRFKRNP
jgi:hypothetical protein